MFRKIFFGFLASILALSLATPVLAAPSFVAPNKNEASVSINSPISDDVYATGGSVVINENIAGDLFVAGGMIEVNANVAGDLLVSGGTVSIRGSVGDDARISGGQVVVYGNVGDDLLVGGGTVWIDDAAVVHGDLLAGAGELRLSGTVLGNVKAGFGSARISGTIDGDADLRYGDDGQLVFLDGARVGGKLDYWAPRETDAFAGVAGEVVYHKALLKGPNWPLAAAIFIPAAMLLGALWALASLAFLGGLLLWLLPKYLPRVAVLTKKNYWQALWQGLLFVIVVPILALLVALTGFGLPVAVVMMLSSAMIMILASIPVSMAIGSCIIKYKENDKNKGRQFLALVVGALIYIVLGLLPFIGWIFKLILILIGVGVIWMDARLMIRKGIY